MKWGFGIVLLLIAMISGNLFAGSSKKDVGMDWKGFFDDSSGCAVFYDPGREMYYIYGDTKVDERRSPCSTFKIISSLLGLKKGVISGEDSVRKWSGERFWKEDWNRDIGFTDAFRASCIWYFREVIDELGAPFMKSGLKELDYGNRDVSDWAGKLNTNESNKALTGFWVESSLSISPREQTEVLNRIFGKDSIYPKEQVARLKQAMLIDQNQCPAKIYGKTGLGKKGKVFADAWFVGFIERPEGDIYFAVHLDASKQPNTASLQARGIALQIASALLSSATL